MSDPAGQNGNSVEGDDEHASEGPGVQQDEVLHWKQQAEQARLEAFQLRCVIDAKDKEIQLLRQQLVDQVDLQDHVDQLHSELSAARRQLAVALGSAQGIPNGSLGPSAAIAAQTYDIPMATREQQGLALHNSRCDTAAVAAAPPSQGNVPGVSQQHANSSTGPAHQQHPQQLPAQATSTTHVQPHAADHLLGLSESVSLQVRSTTATHSWAIARGALLLGGPRSLLAAAHSPFPPGSHFPSQQGASSSPGHTSMQSQQYASRLLQAVLAGARPHVLSRIFTFLSEVWGMGVLPYLHMRAMTGDTGPAASGTASAATNGHAGQAPKREDLQGLPAQNGNTRDKDGASTGPQEGLGAQTKNDPWAGWEGQQESALASVLADAQQQLLLGKDMDQGDMKHLERLAQLLGVNEVVFGQGAGVLTPSIEWLLAGGGGGGTASSISTSQQPFSSTAQAPHAPQAMGDHSHRGSQGPQDMQSMYQPASEHPGYSRVPGVSSHQPRGLGMSMYTLMARLDQQEQERGGYR